jgi:hypothetical protein
MNLPDGVAVPEWSARIAQEANEPSCRPPNHCGGSVE